MHKMTCPSCGSDKIQKQTKLTIEPILAECSECGEKYWEDEE